MKISFKKCSIGALIILIFCSLGMIYFAKDIKAIGASNWITGPRFYPILLACLLILFSVISLIVTIRRPDEEIILPNFVRSAITLAVIIAWAVLWELTGYFYVLSLVSMFLLIMYLNPEKLGGRKIMKAVLLDAIIIGFVYVLFTLILKVKF